MLDKNLIEYAFSEKGYSSLDYLRKIEIYKVLNQLNEEQFDNQTFEEMWDQCKINSKGEIKLQSLMETFIKAQLILINREKDIQNSIERLKQKKLDLKNQINQIQQINQQLQQLQQQKTANSINLQIIRKPFRSFIQKRPNTNRRLKGITNFSEEQQQKFQVKNILISNTQTFSWIFQLTFILLLVQIPLILYYSAFVNIFLFLFILISFVSSYFCRNVLRIQLFAVVFSLIIDLVWYCVQAKTLWNLNQFHDWPYFLSPYLKITVIFISITFLGKIILSLLLISQYNTDESQNKKVSFFGIYKFQLSHQENQKNLFWVLTKNKNSQNQNLIKK